MGETKTFDYYYGVEAEQFSFYRIPRLLIKDEHFKGLSSDAKILYGLMLDRMSLSMKNGWLDEKNRVYIHYTINDIMEDLGCARATCIKVLAELDNKKGIGLIEKRRLGCGKPDIIYVKNFTVVQSSKSESISESSRNSIEIQKADFKKFKNEISRSSKSEPQEVQKVDFKKFKNQISGSTEIEPQEVQILNPNYINNNYTNNYTDLNYINPINPSMERVGKPNDMIDRIEEANVYMALIRQNLDYDHRMKYADQYNDMGLFQEIYEIICDVVSVRHKTIHVNGEDYPYELVKSKFLKLNSIHVEYVMNCMKNTVTKIANIRAYLITALYNAPNTMNHYYQQEVQHDMYGTE